MSKPKPPMADRFYEKLLRLLPFDFRSEFGSDMEETFRAQRAETERNQGFMALLRMWWATVADIVRMAPREHLSVLAQDTRYAWRMMRKNAGYTAAAILILGLGIGANTSIFSVVNSVLLKPLPYLDGNRLVVLRQRQAKTGLENMRFSVPEIDDYRRQNQSLSGLVEYHAMTFTLFGGEEPHSVRTGVVSAGFFDFFGVQPILGRSFAPGDEAPGAQPVLLLSYEFWKQVERGNPNIVGKVYRMNDRPHIVIGVLPPIPQYPSQNDVYMTTTSCPFRSKPDNIANRKFRLMAGVFGRLKPGATPEFCRADLHAVGERLKHDYPGFYPGQMGFEASATLLREDLTRNARPLLLVLLGAAAFVLLIACANVANLILARMARREQELVIRTAVGAGAGRLLRQLLTESLIMALLAAAVGLLFAAGSLKLLTRFASQITPRAQEITLDGWVLAFAILCACATTIVFGSMAALYSRQDVSSGLKENSRTSERNRTVVRSLLIAAQVAFSYVLLIGAGLMVHSFIQLERVDPGFVPQRVFALGLDLDFTSFATAQQYRAVSRRLLEKIPSLPGVLSAAVASAFPMDPDILGGGQPQRFQVEGDPRPDEELPAVNTVRAASPGYFQTLGIPLVAGRPFLDSDDEHAPRVVIVNRSLAHRRWGNENPIGRRIAFLGDGAWLKIVGVVGDVREFGQNRESPYEVYAPLEQIPNAGSVLVRTAGDPLAMVNMLRRAVHEVNPQIAINQAETLEQARADSVSSPRTLTRLFGLFGGLAFLIAITGIASMLALWVRQRAREIGIRMALGASPADIVGAVIRRGMLLAGIGLAAGVGGAWALTGYLKTLLFQVEPTDAVTFLLVAALLLAAALLACFVPAMRAARIDPQAALRAE
ncbi:MAG: ABC transporter permease [Acidobacteriia bacterium]|nr:ABC transporter permease [Terriglobia bacterium]